MAEEPVSRGALIVFEGTDGAGKTSLSHAVEQSLKASGREVHWQAFPDRSTRIGKLINEFLTEKGETKSFDEETIQMLFSANRREVMRGVEEKLWWGVTVIMDRYVNSGRAYSRAAGCSGNWADALDAGLPVPDLTVWLDAPVRSLMSRKKGDLEHYERTEFQEKVREHFANQLVARNDVVILNALDLPEELLKSSLANITLTTAYVKNNPNLCRLDA